MCLYGMYVVYVCSHTYDFMAILIQNCIKTGKIDITAITFFIYFN